MDNWDALFNGQTQYVLELTDSTVLPDVLRFHGQEALSEPFKWDIDFTTAQASITPEQLLLTPASFRMRSGKNVHGIITRLEWLSTSANQSHYRVTLSARLMLLSYTRQCAVYQDQSVPEVVEQVLRKHGLEGADFAFRLERRYPQRELITQWRETDLQFIQRILSEVGIYWCTEMDTTREVDVCIFADSQEHGQTYITLPYSEPAGLLYGAVESVWDVCVWHNVVTGQVSTRDNNYRTATSPMDATVSARNDAVTTGAHYRYVAQSVKSGEETDSEPETESGAFYARLHHERELNSSVRIHLFSNASCLTPGQILEAQGDVITALKDGVILTLVNSHASRDSRLHVSVWGMPDTGRYCFRPKEIPRPRIHGTLPGRIESRKKNDIYAHLDEQGRYRVKLDFDRTETTSGYGYLWLRLAKPFAGEMLGWHTPLIDGTEVAIGYSQGDIDLPYIGHALHDSEHPDPVSRENSSRNVFRTPTNNKLRMEDKRGEEHIKLATEYGRTQLNTGHLVDGLRQRRGTGMELRTDERGTIRAGKGLFVSAESQAKGEGETLERDAALKEIDRLSRQLRELGMVAEQAKALKADIAGQAGMFEQRLKPLNETVLLSAPDGMGVTSGEHLQLAATNNATLNAGGDLSAGVAGTMTVLAGERMGLFARTGQLSLKADEGPVEAQAQNGSVRLFAEKKLTLTSESDIDFAGKKSITLNGGGSYLKLEVGKIEYGTTGTYVRRVDMTMATGEHSRPLDVLHEMNKRSSVTGINKQSDSTQSEEDAGLTVDDGETDIAEAKNAEARVDCVPGVEPIDLFAVTNDFGLLEQKFSGTLYRSDARDLDTIRTRGFSASTDYNGVPQMISGSDNALIVSRSLEGARRYHQSTMGAHLYKIPVSKVKGTSFNYNIQHNCKGLIKHMNDKMSWDFEPERIRKIVKDIQDGGMAAIAEETNGVNFIDEVHVQLSDLNQAASSVEEVALGELPLLNPGLWTDYY